MRYTLTSFIEQCDNCIFSHICPSVKLHPRENYKCSFSKKEILFFYRQLKPEGNYFKIEVIEDSKE